MTFLMQWQQDVILNSMLSKSSVTIAHTLSVDVQSVADFIKSHAEDGISTMDQKIAEKNARRIKPIKAKKKKENVVTSARIAYTPVKRPEKKYADRNLEMNKLIPVRVDHKTYIYVKPGTDIEKTRKAYLEMMNNNSLTQKIKYYGA